jgi:hypothetical protein
MPSSNIPTAVRNIVLSRAGNKCERCGALAYAPLHLHHRKFRSRGGRHVMSNLVALCLHCHEHVHSHGEEARATGYAIPSWVEESEEVPILVPSPSGSKRWVLFTENVKQEWAPVRTDDAKQRLFDLGITKVPA